MRRLFGLKGFRCRDLGFGVLGVLVCTPKALGLWQALRLLVVRLGPHKTLNPTIFRF